MVRGMAVSPLQPQAGAESPPPVSHAKHHGRHHRRSNPVLRRLVIFIGAWVVILGVFAVGMKVVNDRREREELVRMAEYRESLGSQTEGLTMSGRMSDQEFLKEAYPSCQRTLAEFLRATSSEVRLQWVCDSLRLVGAMERFYQANTAYYPTELLENEFIGLIETSQGPVIESLWKAADGRRIEASFRREDGEWRLDWEDFVRFSETPWVMFVAGGGKDVQEFRLLARERLAEERRLEPSVSLVLHPPRFGVPDEPGTVSPEFLMPRLSDTGRELEALFKMKREGKVPLGARVPSQDPEDMIRLRVRIKRVDDEKSRRRFEIEEVLAAHWMSIEETGFPAPEPEDGEVEESGSGG